MSYLWKQFPGVSETARKDDNLKAILVFSFIVFLTWTFPPFWHLFMNWQPKNSETNLKLQPSLESVFCKGKIQVSFFIITFYQIKGVRQNKVGKETPVLTGMHPQEMWKVGLQCLITALEKQHHFKKPFVSFGCIYFSGSRKSLTLICNSFLSQSITERKCKKSLHYDKHDIHQMLTTWLKY